jgi:DNA-binding NarL/FixJ family response regulator
MTKGIIDFTAESTSVVIVDDHDAIRFGFKSTCQEYNFELLADAASVSECLAALGEKRPQVAVLDLSLSDGSNVSENVDAFASLGIQVLVYSIGDKARLNQAALKAGAAALVTKSQSMQSLAETIYLVAHGQLVNNLQTTAAIDSDLDFKDAKLSPREREVLSLYASGLSQKQTAFALDIKPSTVKEHIDRVRVKYADVGRPVTDKTAFLKRALEDGLLE